MRQHLILILLALTLFSCGEAKQQQNPSSDNPTNNSTTIVESTTETAESAEYTHEGLLPELVFNNLEFSAFSYADANHILPTVKNAKRIVIRGDEMRISDGKNEISCKINLATGYEEAMPDAYYWTFHTIGNQALPEIKFSVSSEYEEACIVRNLDPQKRPISLVFDEMGLLYPKDFNSWDNLKRKITPNYPSDEEYDEILAYINREEPDPDY